MRSIILTVTLVLFLTSLFGQGETSNHKIVANKFDAFYNTGNFDSIFAMFSDGMKKALPIERTNKFFTELFSQSGKILKREFTKYQDNYTYYKTNFERALFSVNISIDDNSRIDGIYVKPFTDESLPQMVRNISKLALPFKGEWTVFWGGDTKELNAHAGVIAQKNAFDIIITNGINKSYKTDGKSNEDYYAFGKELFAPCDGVVVLVVDGIKDNKPGILNPVYVPGNTVIIQTVNNEYLFFAHFKQHSIKVKEGQKVKAGQLLGLCGNSGNSSEPHLHFHIQNVEDINVATGVKCYFDNLIVNGQQKKDYSPIKGDKIKSR